MSMPAVLTYRGVLQWSSARLAAVSDIAMLEAEVLLADVLQVSRSHIHAWPERELTVEQCAQFVTVVNRCLLGEPIAYIVGRREFWSLDLMVTPDTLIPRPETELLVELVLSTLSDKASGLIADLGTGSGAIALALATEKPAWMVHATDCMPKTLLVAKANAERLQLPNVIFHAGDWLQALPLLQFDAIVSNPPYIALDDDRITPQVKSNEPHSALFSGVDGLDAIREIISNAKSYLKTGGYLFLEHGSLQATAVRYLFENAGYTKINLHKDLAGLERVTIGCLL